MQLPGIAEGTFEQCSKTGADIGPPQSEFDRRAHVTKRVSDVVSVSFELESEGRRPFSPEEFHRIGDLNLASGARRRPANHFEYRSREDITPDDPKVRWSVFGLGFFYQPLHFM